MNSRHHVKGDAFPPLKKGLLRYYGMRFCPFAQRTLMLLIHKGIPFETVNIHLQPAEKKPDWFLERNPLGLVPCIEDNGNIVYDSKVCNYYLDKVYPNNKLTPDDPFEEAKIDMLMEHLSKVPPALFGVGRIDPKDKALIDEKLSNLKAALKPFEDALKKPFFGGESVGMLDVFVWPFIERLVMIEPILKEPVLSKKDFPKLTAWTEKMNGLEMVKRTKFDKDIHQQFFETYKVGKSDYDGVLKNVQAA